MSSKHEKVVILGVGNLLMGDDGIGVHVVRAMQEQSLAVANTSLELWDAGTSPDLAHLALGADKVIVVDAAQMGGEPGTIYLLHPDHLGEGEPQILSLHERSLRHGLAELAALNPRAPEIVIVGVEPGEIKLGIELSPEIRRKIPRIISAILDQLQPDQTA